MCETEHSVSILDCGLRSYLQIIFLFILASNENVNYLRATRKWPLDLSCSAYLIWDDLTLLEWGITTRLTNEYDAFVGLHKNPHEI